MFDYSSNLDSASKCWLHEDDLKQIEQGLAAVREEIEAIRDNMSETLTELEGDVLRLYMDGKSYEEIAGALGNHVKSIDNALQRIKRKLQKHIDQRNALAS